MTLQPQIAPTGQPEEDRQLLARVARKDRQAFEVLYRRYYLRVFQFVRLGVADGLVGYGYVSL